MYPHERSLVKRMENRPFALIGVNSDPKEKVLAAMERENITWRSFWNGGSTRGPISGAWGVHSWPTIYILDDRGVIRYKNARGEAMDEAVDKLVEEAIGRLLEYVKSDDADVRGLAAFRMGKYNVAGAVAEIAPLLKDRDPVVKQRAAAGLALRGQPVQPLLPLIRLAALDIDAEVRIASLLTLGTAKDKQAIELAMRALDDKRVDVRRAAVATLGKLGDLAAVPALTKAVDDKDIAIARNAVYALADLNAPVSTKVLKELASRSDHPARVWVVVAMHRLGEGNTAEGFKALLSDDDVKIRRQAATALAELKEFDAIDLMVKALQDDDSQVSKIARQLLAKSDSPRARKALHEFLVSRIDTLITALSNSDAPVSPKARREAFKARSELRALGSEAAPLLLKKMDGELPPMARNLVAAAIGSSGNTDVIEPIVKKLTMVDLPKNQRLSYETVLMYFRNKAGEPVADLLEQSDPVVRLSGVRVLGSQRDAASAKLLLAALQDEDLKVRGTAAYSLARQRNPSALPVLKELAEQKDLELLRYAAMGLAMYGDQNLPILLKMLESDNPAVRSSVVGALGQIKSKEATEAIAKAIGEHEQLASIGCYALYRQGTSDAAKTLGDLLKSDNSNVQQSAKMWLGRMRVPEAGMTLLQYLQEQQAKNKKDE